MIDLAYPWMLFLLLTVPLFVWLRYGATRSTVRFSDGHVLSRLRRTWAVRAWPLLPALYAAALACMVASLARPRHGLRESLVRTEAVDIILLVDVSSSMRAEDFSTNGKRRNRLDSAKDVIGEFIAKRPNDRIGLVAFAAMPYLVAPLSLDQDWLAAQVDRLTTDMLEDGTAIGSALASAVNHLRDSEAVTKLVILLTDGENNAGSISPENAARAGEALGIKVYTVGAGTEGFVQIPYASPFGGVQYRRMWSQIDEATLKEIARVTGGTYFRAQDTSSLTQVYEEIDELEKTEIDVQYYTQFEEKFAVFLVPGVLLLGLEKLLSLTRLGRLPL